MGCFLWNAAVGVKSLKLNSKEKTESPAQLLSIECQEADSVARAFSILPVQYLLTFRN